MRHWAQKLAVVLATGYILFLYSERMFWSFLRPGDMRIAAVLFVVLLFGTCSCSGPSGHRQGDAWRKVELDLAQLDETGLRGPPDGKVAAAYEFAIPNTNKCRAEVAAIDRTVQFMPGSRGRVGAGKEQCLCIGSTHQEHYREVLRRLAALPYVERIVECHFE